jgi:hypothetical protein
MNTIIRIPDVCERDIDLLLLEEFIASVEFCRWFLAQIKVDDEMTLVDAARSVVTPNGESDIELTFVNKRGKSKLLIENKVDAAFQPNQPQRYTDRACEYRNTGDYDLVMTILMAPESYFGDESSNFGFDQLVTYENVVTWFTDSGIGEARKEYKLGMLREAISRGKVGWKLTPHENVGAFWKHYWELAEEMAPQLAMPVPKKEIPAGSSFITFSPAILPNPVSIVHKVAYGNVDLQFASMGDKLPELETLYRAALAPNMRIENASKSAVIRIRVEPIDMTTAVVVECADIIRDGIRAAESLLELYRKVSVENT